MMSLILGMLRARRGQAVTLALLALFAVAAAVAAPAYLRAVDRAVVAGQVATATPAELSLTVRATVNEQREPGGVSFADVGGAIVALPGFTQVFAEEFPAIGIEPDPREASRLLYRQDVCAHVTVVTGRCLAAAGEVMLGERTADRLHLAAGDLITLTYAVISTDPTRPIYVADGDATPLTIAGTYRTPDPDGQYWGSHDYFRLDHNARPGEPVLTTAETVRAMSHGPSEVSIDATAAPGTITEASLPGLRRDLAGIDGRGALLGRALTLSTGIPQLLDRIDRSRDLARRSIPVGAAPLLLLAYAVIFIATGYGTEGRRPELAVIALRGARWWTRWWLTVGENLAALLAGGLAGCVAGQLLVAAVVAWRFPGVDTPVLGLDALRWAPWALLGAVVAMLLAQRRHLVSGVADLMRRVRAQLTGWRLVTAEIVVGLLAVAATAQLFLTGGSLAGIALAAPALVIVALALAAARAVVPLARAAGDRALRRGRLGAALAAFQLARRPGAQRLLLLLTAAVAVLGFAVTAADVAARDRDLAARIGTGAPRVLTVAPLTRAQLLHAVRAADPAGDYAMAVAALPAGGPGETPKLAVDATRLATVATWQDEYGDLDARRVGALLRPPAPAPVVIAGQDVSLDVTVNGAVVGKPVGFSVVLSSVTGRGTATVGFGVLHDGPYTFQQRTAVCAGGCRVAGLHFTPDTTASGVKLTIVLRGIGSINPAAVAVSGTDLADVSRWRSAGATLTAAPDGLRVTLDAPEGLPDGAWVQAADIPAPLPVVTTTTLPAASTASAVAVPGGSTVGLPGAAVVAGFDGLPVEVRAAGRVTAVPRLGTDGTLVDLEYADRAATDAGEARNPEVWLGAAAPADVLDRLTAQGLVITGDRGVAATQARLAAQGPALAVWFHVLSGILAVILGAGGLALVIAVDRRERLADLTALRAQGLSRRCAARTLLWTYPVLVATSGILGLATAMLTWRLTGWALPVFGEDLPDLPLPSWPGPVLVPSTWLLTVTLLTTVALAAGRPTPATATPRP
ncbi:FtsX-like permease family protein [Dactylosporangium sp. NPDC005555]|uniref:FtsX-like permease family protein n=1 Tax=Dactylosporangium sp. NPDC005555 TaxID=3154889 RepID=UPI0033AEFBBD